MAFKINDLLINVEPGTRELGECSPNFISGCRATPLFVSLWNCFVDFNTCPILFKPGDAAISRELVATLKEQLRRATEDLDRVEVVEVGEPKTLAEIEDLQQRLRKAIDTLDRRKEQLKEQ